MAAETQKVIRAPESKQGAQEMSIARLETVVSDILRLLEDLPPAYRLHALRMAEERIKPLSIAKKEIIRKLSISGRGYYVALPIEFSSMVGTYRAYVEKGKLILEPTGNDVHIRTYNGKLRMKLPKRLVEAIGFPAYVHIRAEGSRIVVEPAG